MNYKNCDGITYTIKQGDTLYGISRKYNVPLALILRANPYADVYRLNIGDTICIPVKRKCCDCGDKTIGRRNMSSDNQDYIPENEDSLENMSDMADNTNYQEENAGAKIASSMGDINLSKNMNLPDKMVDMEVGIDQKSDVRNLNMEDDEKWVKYVAQPGDTLWDVFNKSKCDLNEFLNKNGLKGIYILPGLVYFVKEK